VKRKNPEFGCLLENQKITGIFSSPPYVGLIDYHEQHAYAYDLFGFERKDELEIGPLFKGNGKDAQQSYIQGISDVLKNCKKYLADDYSVFLVANDKYNMYPTIAQNTGMKIVNQFKRPVLNRTEKDKTAYSEIIFHLKEK
ncbi:MAG: site-specific DNA-methyltransferase, partial [Prevotellaceae bacterium]|nr:site-specific DNA-methyltransferase [Prevotellaceae bacterium]